MKVGVVQYAPSFGKPAENMLYVEEMLLSLGSGSVDVLVLPEMAFTGYEFDSLEEIKPFLESAGKGPTFSWCQTQAKSLAALVACGYPEKCECADGEIRLYNSMQVVSPEGKLVANVRKSFLYETDKLWCASEGEGFQTLYDESTHTKIGFGICMDINPYEFQAPFENFEFANFLAREKVDLVLFSSAWVKGEQLPINYWCIRLSPLIEAAQEEDRDIVFVAADRVGKDKHTSFAGGSCVISLREPALLGALDNSSAAVLVVDLNTKRHRIHSTQCKNGIKQGTAATGLRRD